MPSAEQQTLRYIDFESFYRSQWQEVYRPLAVVLRNPDLARDATNEAMERALRSWNRVKGMGNQTGWVYRVAHNWAIDQLRKKSRLRRLTKAPPELVWQPTVPDPEVFRAVNSLPSDQRTVVVLRLVEDWSVDEVAEALDVPSGTVKSRLSRALDRLREELS